MTVNDLISAGFESVYTPDPGRELCGVYIGDLLSWVMGRASANNAWITIMSNVNVAAVATLADIGCVILAESVEPDKELLSAANAKGINLLKCGNSAYEAALRLNSLGL